MANKRKAPTTLPPDPAAFLGVLDAGQADPVAVALAYEKAVRAWQREHGVAVSSSPPRDAVVSTRPDDADDDADADPVRRMTLLVRLATLSGGRR